MATLPAAGYISDATRTEGEAKVAFEDMLLGIKQIPGAGVAETTLTIASGSVTPPDGAGTFNIDTEAGASTDDLTNIIQTNIPDGGLLLIRSTNSARVTTVKNSSGGAGQIVLQGGLDVVLADPKQWMLIKRKGSLWEDVFGPTILNMRISNGTVVADPTAALGIVSKQYADQHGFTTGDVKLTLKTVADTSWVLMNDTTIGNASSGATGRANADTSALFSLLWANILDSWAPVSGGRGANAAADFAANKTIALPRTLGRALAGYGTGLVVASGVDADVDLTGNTLQVLSNNTKWVTGMSVVFTLASGSITGLVTSTTYRVIRVSDTLIQLASTLANAQNGVPIDFTAKSSPVWTVTHTYTTRVLGEAGGENAHAMSSTELLFHNHQERYDPAANAASAGPWIAAHAAGGGDTDTTGASNSVTSTGGNTTANILQPTAFMNVMVKL